MAFAIVTGAWVLGSLLLGLLLGGLIGSRGTKRAR